MLTPLALFLGLFAATAFIAHWSDNLGKKLGKKRVSIFGLRPRTSATVITVVTSWGIMLLTLTALLVTVAPLKDALFRIDSVRKQLFDLGQQLQTSKERLPIVQGQLRTAQGEAETARSQATQAQASYNQAKAQIAAANTAKAQAEAGANAAQKSERIAQQGEKGAKQATRTAQRAAQEAEQSAQSARQNLVTAQAGLSAVQSQLVSSKTQLDRNRKELGRVQFNLHYTRTQLASTQKQLNTTSQAEQKASKAAFRASKAAFEAAKFARQVGDQNVLLANSDIALSVDQTLSERRLPAKFSPEEAQEQLRLMIVQAQQAAQFLLKNNNNEALAKEVKVVPVGMEFDKNGNIDPQSEARWLNLYGRVLASGGQSVVARLIAAANTSNSALLNVPVVEARLILVPQLSIPAGKVFSQGLINGAQREGSIYDSLNNLIDKARRNATALGVSPPLSTEAPKFFAVDTSQKVLVALREVQLAGRPVLVRIVAARDLNTAEPPQIRFEIGDPGTR